MFLRPRENPPGWYRTLYLALCVGLGAIASYGAHALIELWWLKQANPAEIAWRSHVGSGACALPVWLEYGLLGLGLSAGWLMGRTWWRWVYVERRWARR